jgi:hypothetical protein
MSVNNEVHIFHVRYDVMSAVTLTVLVGFLNSVPESLLSQCQDSALSLMTNATSTLFPALHSHHLVLMMLNS